MCERISFRESCEDQFYLYIAGDAGTGKSFVSRVMIEATKFLKAKPGDELNKPKCIVMAPTANAAYIINGKTIESALQMLPKKSKHIYQN